ncbi:hypothetical protein IRT38_01410 (plasmid) [Acinetobacter sp. SK-43]|uniref:hypothetical protein n=1 Tax=Acinetobacter sp. SK-43 TaxID=2785295 RepID=UPI00188C9385|nr:hypothetical protein [Acinetobacter sp. SK-43]MBF4454075.1 hypothetical protein [Acinetobacter sp. SK-43]
MKYLSLVVFAVCFLVFMLFTENFMIAMNQKILFWDYMTTVLNRESFMQALGWGVALIFCVFTSFVLLFAVFLALSFTKPKIVIQVRLNSLASAHLLMIYAILICCICGQPVYQIISNVFILHGFANYLIWFMLPIAAGIAYSAIAALVAAFKGVIKAFKS